MLSGFHVHRVLLGSSLAPMIPSITRTLLLLCVCCSAVYIDSASAAKLYRWVDDAGRVHFSDKPLHQAESVEVRPPPRQDSSQDDQRQQLNRQWFEEERQRREKLQAAEKKQQAKKAKARKKRQAGCKKSLDRRDNARAQLKARKRAGVTPKHEAKLKLRLEGLERKARQAC